MSASSRLPSRPASLPSLQRDPRGRGRRRGRAALRSVAVALGLALGLVASARADEEGAAAGAARTPVYDVYVTSSRDLAEQVSTVRRLDREDLEQEAARTLDEALVHVPNLVVRTGGDGVPRIDLRGLRSRHLTLLVDGIPFNSTADGQFDASLVPTQLIESIDLVTSNSSVLYGDGGIAGVLQIRTRTPSEELEATGSLDVRERSQYQPEATLSGVTGPVEAFVAGRYLDSQGYDLPASFEGTSVENGSLRENSGREQANFFAKLGHVISPEARVGMLVDVRKAEFGVPPNTVDDPNDRFAPSTRFERVEDLEGFSAQLNGQLDPEGPLSLRAWGFVNRQEENRVRYDDAGFDTIRSGGSFDVDETTLITGGALHGRHALGTWGELRFAVNGRYEQLETDGLRCVLGGGG
ncbi:MAG TPA: TonB-dependent receptor, partial [Myxococcota bacterium]|nr:TonB-dependent receptor [Myxococcota bacterium]